MNQNLYERFRTGKIGRYECTWYWWRHTNLFRNIAFW